MPLNEALLASTAGDAVTRADTLLARFNPRDRAAIDKHLATCDAEPDRDHATLWRRLAGFLGSLTPAASRALPGDPSEVARNTRTRDCSGTSTCLSTSLPAPSMSAS